MLKCAIKAPFPDRPGRNHEQKELLATWWACFCTTDNIMKTLVVFPLCLKLSYQYLQTPTWFGASHNVIEVGSNGPVWYDSHCKMF